MTHIIKPSGKALTAIAVVFAFSSTQTFAQETGAPTDPVADTLVQTPETVDPLAGEPAAEESPVVPEAVVPPASKPKVEIGAARAQRAKPTASKTAARSTVRRASAAAPAAQPTTSTAEATAPPTALSPEPQSPVTAEPTAPPNVQPTASDTPNAPTSSVMTEDMLPIAGAAALGLIALGGAGIVAQRRRRRREVEEFETRQQALAIADAEPTLEPGPAAEVRSGPVFTKSPAPTHDPVPARAAASKMPARGNWASRSEADFMFRPTDKLPKRLVEQD